MDAKPASAAPSRRQGQDDDTKISWKDIAPSILSVCHPHDQQTSSPQQHTHSVRQQLIDSGQRQIFLADSLDPFASLSVPLHSTLSSDQLGHISQLLPTGHLRSPLQSSLPYDSYCVSWAINVEASNAWAFGMLKLIK